MRRTTTPRPLRDLDSRLFQGRGEGLLTVRRYAPGDAERLALRGDFARAFDAIDRELPIGLRWTLAGEGDRPLAVGGLEPLAGTTWNAWGLASALDHRAWAFVRRAAGAVIAYAERELGARRIEALACDTPGAVALLARMGFKVVGARLTGPDGARYVPMQRTFGGSV